MQFSSFSLPTGFIYLEEVCPQIIQDIRYATANNFTGKVVPGYKRNVAIITEVAGQKLSQIQKEIKLDGLGLKVFDIYRPVMAVEAFKTWSDEPEDNSTKQRFYPDLEKQSLFGGGYISTRSAHSRGSTVDLTIVNLDSKEEIDMGTEFDFFGEQSHTPFNKLPEAILNNRKYLLKVMERHGFENYWREWWHYQLKEEPFSNYPEDHFNFIVQ